MSRRLILSTGLVNRLAGTDNLRTIMTGKKLYIYTGTIPTDADNLVDNNNLLMVVTGPSNAGLEWEAAVSNGVLQGSTTQTRSGSVTAGGVATFFRFEDDGDTKAASTTEERVQGLVGDAGFDLWLQDTTLVVGQSRSLPTLQLALNRFYIA